MSGERTEKPTQKRRQELRRKGLSTRSAELSSGIGMMMAAIALPMAARNLASALLTDISVGLSGAGSSDLTSASSLARTALLDGFTAIIVPVALVGGAGLVASVALTREKPSMSWLKPRPTQLNPKNGFKRVFSPHGLQDALKTLVKLTLVVAVGVMAWQSGATHLINSPGDMGGSIATIGAACTKLLGEVGAIALFAGIVDALLARRRFNKSAKMSKNDVRDEGKQQEINPHVKSAMRQKAFTMSRSRMMAAIAGADVVLANPTHIAVALRYEPGSSAPIVVAKGADLMALRIKDEARRHDIPIVEDRPLARALFAAADIGDSIPVEMFRAVAEVLATVYAARRRRGLPLHRPAVAGTGSRPTRRPRPASARPAARSGAAA